jgi:hypothetical protein
VVFFGCGIAGVNEHPVVLALNFSKIIFQRLAEIFIRRDDGPIDTKADHSLRLVDHRQKRIGRRQVFFEK